MGMKAMKIGVMSDIHLYRKTDRFACALEASAGVEVLLLVGDIADRAQKEQYDLAYACIRERLGDIPVYCVSGNHDNPARNDAHYRAFEEKIHPQWAACMEENGAFYQRLGEMVDLFGLNPTYHQKQFFFPEKGKQLAFLREKLEDSTALCHILLCHPPLIAHNPQGTKEMAPYITKEQNDKLQKIVDETGGVVFLSGHTHVAPAVEWEEKRRNLYINDGSICPTSLGDGQIQQGNITILEIEKGKVSVLIKGIHTGKVFYHREFSFKAKGEGKEV